jgi:DNA-directed RNA polymerase specialized sigma24 family protein
MSSKEIDEVLGKAEGTVKALQFAALKRLRKEAGQ